MAARALAMVSGSADHVMYVHPSMVTCDSLTHGLSHMLFFSKFPRSSNLDFPTYTGAHSPNPSLLWPDDVEARSITMLAVLRDNRFGIHPD